MTLQFRCHDAKFCPLEPPYTDIHGTFIHNYPTEETVQTSSHYEMNKVV